VDGAVDPPPTALELRSQRRDVGVVVDVEVEDGGLRVEPGRRALGHPLDPAEAGQHHLGALLLRPLRDREADRAPVDHPGDHQLLALEDHR